MEEKNINTLLDQMKNQFNGFQSEESSIKLGMFSADKATEKMSKNDKPNSTESKDDLKGNDDTSSTRETPENKSPQNTKRSSRWRLSGHNKSIIQNAIARKEKSFEDYTKPTRKIRKISKGSDVTDDKKEVPLKRFQKSPNTSKSSKNLLGEPELSASASHEDDSSPRRSQRSLLSENQGENKDHELEKELEREAAVLKRQIEARLCKCTENRKIFSESDTDSQFCAGMDTIDNKLMGCNRLVNVKTVPLLRPSARVPFALFCDAHRQRLTRHNCCSTCGVFCTQGQFQECPSKHHFHKECKLTIGNKDYCPHCGDAAASRAIKITMHTAKPPIFLPEQKAQQ